MTKRELLLEKLTDALELCIEIHLTQPDVHVLEAGDNVREAIELVEATLPPKDGN